MTAEPAAVLRDRAAYLPVAGSLVCADLHLGRAALSAVDLPLEEGRSIVDRLAALIERFSPAEVVLAGDVLHGFSTVPAAARDALEALGRVVDDSGAALVAIEGNHDPLLGTIAEPVNDHRLADGSLVVHGHEPPAADADRYLVGHDHPAITIEGRRRPCWLWGRETYAGADVLVLPAFNPLVPGTPVNQARPGDLQSPLVADPGAFRPVVADPAGGEPVAFPPLSSLRAHL